MTARRGGGEAVGEGGKRVVIEEGQSIRFNDSALKDYKVNVSSPDDFDLYCKQRQERHVNVPARNYVSENVVGYEDLDEYGTWETAPQYGHVWYPTAVAADWAPYHAGHWVWVDPWGWSWIDDAPWGFAPFHYGRWAYVGTRWGWVPGPVDVAPVYAPALVAFVGGGGFGVNVSVGGPIGWFALGPGDVYFPGYCGGHDYFNRVSYDCANQTVANNCYGAWSSGNVELFADEVCKPRSTARADRDANCGIRIGTSGRHFSGRSQSHDDGERARSAARHGHANADEPGRGPRARGGASVGAGGPRGRCGAHSAASGAVFCAAAIGAAEERWAAVERQSDAYAHRPDKWTQRGRAGSQQQCACRRRSGRRGGFGPVDAGAECRQRGAGGKQRKCARSAAGAEWTQRRSLGRQRQRHCARSPRALSRLRPSWRGCAPGRLRRRTRRLLAAMQLPAPRIAARLKPLRR